MPEHSWQSLFSAALTHLETAQLLRHRRVARPLNSTHVEVDGHRLINFASNDYLGLTHHPRVLEAWRIAAEQFGVGSGAAPLISGYTPAHASAEQAIARWKQTEGAVLFSSGYQANLAVIGALSAVASRSESPVRFLLDKLCHASLVDAVRGTSSVAGEETGPGHFRVFPHNQLAKLDRLIAENAAAEKPALDVIVTESIFSMDGDAADLAGIVAIAEKQATGVKPLLLVDEAHGSGVYGADGAGLAAELGLRDAIDVTVVTLSKALGVIGAAVCGSRAFCEVLVNLARPYIFSTSMPAAVAAAAEASIDVLREEPNRQQRVRDLSRYVRRQVVEMGFEIPAGDSPIIPIVLGEASSALAAAESLRGRGIYVLAIRPPTVPRGGSRLRITLSSEHRDAEIQLLLEGLREIRG